MSKILIIQQLFLLKEDPQSFYKSRFPISKKFLLSYKSVLKDFPNWFYREVKSFAHKSISLHFIFNIAFRIDIWNIIH